MDICWGYDLMKKHRYVLDSSGEKDVLKIGGKNVPMLEENELPQNIETLQ